MQGPRAFVRAAQILNLPVILLHNRLQLARVAQSVLDDHVAVAHHILLRLQCLGLLLREVYPAILCSPASRLCELDDSAFGWEEEEV